MERRDYMRININKDCVIYYKDEEYNAIIKDISQTGIAFIADATTANKISKGSMRFIFLDNDIIVKGKALLKRKGSHKEGIVLGCQLINIEPHNYPIDKEIKISITKFSHLF